MTRSLSITGFVEQTAGGGVHQVAGASHNRQRAGRGQEWGGGAQTHRTRTDRSRACRRVSAFLLAEFNPYLNYHRPCGFATVEVDGKGKRRRRYRLGDYRTPYEKLLSLDQWESYLKPGVTAAFLEQQAGRMSDTECALRTAAQERTAGREPLAVVGGRRAAGTFARPPGSLRPGCARRETAARGERKPMDRNVAADLEHAPDERPPAPSQPPRPCPLERRSLPTPALLPTQTRFRIILGLENAVPTKALDEIDGTNGEEDAQEQRRIYLKNVEKQRPMTILSWVPDARRRARR